VQKLIIYFKTTGHDDVLSCFFSQGLRLVPTKLHNNSITHTQ